MFATFFTVDGVIGNSNILAGRWYEMEECGLLAHLPELHAQPATQHGCIFSGRCSWEFFLQFGAGLAHGW